MCGIIAASVAANTSTVAAAASVSKLSSSVATNVAAAGVAIVQRMLSLLTEAGAQLKDLIQNGRTLHAQCQL